MRLETSTKLVDSVIRNERRVDTSVSICKDGALILTQTCVPMVAGRPDLEGFRCQGVIITPEQTRALRWYLSMYMPSQRALPRSQEERDHE